MEPDCSSAMSLASSLGNLITSVLTNSIDLCELLVSEPHVLQISCIITHDWEATKCALASTNLFIANFAAQGITPPCLLYKVNSNGSFQPKSTVGAIKDTSTTMSKDLSAVMNEVRSLRSKFNHHWDQVDQSLHTVGKHLLDVSGNISHFQGHALERQP